MKAEREKACEEDDMLRTCWYRRFSIMKGGKYKRESRASLTRESKWEEKVK